MAKKKEKEESFTPMVEQYLSIKKQYPDIIVFFRLGDFYEMFMDDAVLCSKELQLFLTSKACGNGKKIPMCGIPHRAYLSYAQKLVDRGYKVGICEQTEDPKTTKKLVKRDIIQIITPGANLDLNDKYANYIAAASFFGNTASIAYADLSTGEMFCLNCENSNERILEELLKINVRELVVSTSSDANTLLYIKNNSRIPLSYFNDSTASLENERLFSNLKDDRQTDASARLFNYLISVEKRDLDYFKPVKNVLSSKTMKIDYSAQSNMELVKSLEGKQYGSLLWLLDKTNTPMGSRYLKTKITAPSASREEIEAGLDVTELFVNHYVERTDLQKILKSVFDMERLIARMGYQNCNGHDLLQLKRSLACIAPLKAELDMLPSTAVLDSIKEGLGDYDALLSLLERSISEDCPLTVSEGGIFKKGYSQELDELIDLTSDAKDWIVALENRERERTGIRNLKVGYNTVFGYYIEVSAGQVSEVKDEYGYIRKQTLKTGERYITAELKEKEDRILRAKDERAALEYRLFKELREKVSMYTEQIQSTSEQIAKLDYFLALAEISSSNGYVRPAFSYDHSIEIKDARHPILEAASPDVPFVANDYHMDKDTDVLIITGPNMGGKSTYMKEFGLISILAQMSCFVPAASCSLPIFDSLYTRIGASDNLIKGQSTFMTEMSEVATALREASSDSLFLFDEIGRGTATYDGMAIAQSIIEYIVKHIRCKTLFSTHYHEITSLSEKIDAVKNIHCEVSEDHGEITFLYKMVEGSMDKSYGVNVAKLASLPEEVTDRAGELLKAFESNKNVSSKQAKEIKREEKKEDPVSESLKKVDPMSMSPLDALNYVIALKKMVK